MIELRGVSVVYSDRTEALTEVNLKIGEGEFAFVVGPTGEGKTTLLRLINREVVPTRGQVFVSGREITHLAPGRVPYLRRTIGFIFQDFRLIPYQTVMGNVAFALRVVGAGKREMRQRVPELLARVGLSHKADALPSQLSGGEQQRVSIARALAHRPTILLADEPTGNLDPTTSWDIMKLLDEINRSGTTVVVATHDKLIVDGMHRRVIELSAGRVVRDDPAGAYHHGTVIA